MTKEDYNQEPVSFCAHCLSLCIKELNDIKICICGECGNTDIKTSDIDSWNKLYVSEYGKMFLHEDFDSIVE